MMNLEQRQARAVKANLLLQKIGDCGRRFFYYKGRYAKLSVRDNGRVWFRDEYTQKDIYTHSSRQWSGFNHGGTMRNLIQALRDYITGVSEHIPRGILGPWPSLYAGGDPWGYGCDMEAVRSQARYLGLTPGL